MKNFRIITLFVAILATSYTLISCGDSSSSENTEQQGKEYTSVYICPMHCDGSGSDEPGKCPICGMDYVKNEEHDHKGHSH